MAERTEYANGTPSWVEIGTTDVAGAEKFYSGILGWEADHQPMGEGMVYSMQTIGGKNAAAVYDQREDQKAAGMPPMWLTYITVDDVDATTAKVGPAGGSVMQEPFDVFEAGRMSIIADPAGGIIGLWQAKDHIGSQLSGEHGAISWNEYMSSGTDKSKAFFEAVLGVTFFADPGMGGYSMMMVDGAPVAGVIQRSEQMPELANPWLVYFAVDDCDAAFAKATSTGAAVVVPPMDIPPGRFSILKDPQEAEFGVIKVNPDYSPGG
jgi:hypothetical protein